MLRHRIRREPLACLAEQRALLQPPSRPGDAGFRVDDDVIDVDQLCLRERHEREQRRSRIAARAGHQPRRPDLLAIELGQPVDRFLLQLRRAVRVAVPLRVDVHVEQAEVGRHVDHLDRRIGGEHRGGDLLRGAVRQAAEHRVEALPVDLLPFGQARQVEHEEVRKHLVHLFARMGVGGERRDLDIGMAGEQPHRIRAGVARRAEHGDLGFCRHASRAPASAACSAPPRPRRPCPDCRGARPAPPGGARRLQTRRARACWSR